MRRRLNPLIRQSPSEFAEVPYNGGLKGQRIVTLLKEDAGSTGYANDGGTIGGLATPYCVASHRDHGIPHVGRVYRPWRTP